MQIANDKIIYKELSYKLNGIFFRVQNELGRYKNEKQYCDAIENLLKIENMAYQREFILPESFNGEHKGRNKIDFIVENKIIIEVKAKTNINADDYLQARRYLSATNRKLALLANFRRQHLVIKRILNSKAEE